MIKFLLGSREELLLGVVGEMFLCTSIHQCVLLPLEVTIYCFDWV